MIEKRKARHAFAWRAFLPKEELHVRSFYADGFAGRVSGVVPPAAPPIGPP